MIDPKTIRSHWPFENQRRVWRVALLKYEILKCFWFKFIVVCNFRSSRLLRQQNKKLYIWNRGIGNKWSWSASSWFYFFQFLIDRRKSDTVVSWNSIWVVKFGQVGHPKWTVLTQSWAVLIENAFHLEIWWIISVLHCIGWKIRQPYLPHNPVVKSPICVDRFQYSKPI